MVPDAKKLLAGPWPYQSRRAASSTMPCRCSSRLSCIGRQTKRTWSWHSEPAKYELGEGIWKSEHGRSCDDSSMGGDGGTQPRAPSATAVVNEELGGGERDGDGGGGGGRLGEGHGGVGMRAG